jgi:hypothetical protein
VEYFARLAAWLGHGGAVAHQPSPPIKTPPQIDSREHASTTSDRTSILFRKGEALARVDMLTARLYAYGSHVTDESCLRPKLNASTWCCSQCVLSTRQLERRAEIALDLDRHELHAAARVDAYEHVVVNPSSAPRDRSLVRAP